MGGRGLVFVGMEEPSRHRAGEAGSTQTEEQEAKPKHKFNA
jgi:hypothetical protein